MGRLGITWNPRVFGHRRTGMQQVNYDALRTPKLPRTTCIKSRMFRTQLPEIRVADWLLPPCLQANTPVHGLCKRTPCRAVRFDAPAPHPPLSVNCITKPEYAARYIKKYTL